MAGSNGILKYERVNREDQVILPKFRDTIFTTQDFVLIAGATNPNPTNLTAEQLLSPLQFTAGTTNPVNAPTMAALTTQYQLFNKLELGAGAQVTYFNTSGVTKTITFPAGWNIPSLIIPPNSSATVYYYIHSLGPPVVWTAEILSSGSNNGPHNILSPEHLDTGFGPGFGGPATDGDILIFDAQAPNQNTPSGVGAWVPSKNDNAGGTGTTHPFFHLGRGHVYGVFANNPDTVGFVLEASANNFDHAIIVADFDTPTTLNNPLNTTCITADTLGTTNWPRPTFRDSLYSGFGLSAANASASGFNPGGYAMLFQYTNLFTTNWYVKNDGRTKIFAPTVAAGTAVVIDINGELGVLASSIKYKENLKDLGAEDTSFINKLKLTWFNYKNDAEKQPNIGVIMEQLQDLNPPNVGAYLEMAPAQSLEQDKPPQKVPVSVNTRSLLFALMHEHQKLADRVAALEAKLSHQ